MEPYVLKVVRADGGDPDPTVSETALARVDELFTEICRNIVKAELRLQNEVPKELYVNVKLMDDGALAHDGRRFMDETLDYLGGASQGTWMSDTYPDVPGRKRIASMVLALSRTLDGHILLHGYGDEPPEFSGVDTIWVSGIAQAVTRAYNGSLMGVVVKDPGRRDHWAITDGTTMTPLIFVSGFSRYDVEDFAAAGPVIAQGTIIRDDDDALVELRTVENCFTFPVVLFLRAIAPGRDLGLVYPLEANPGYYARTRTWYLRCQDLGLEASGNCWDECVGAFHSMFIDLWEAHRDGRAEENPRMSELLNRMCPFAGIEL